MSIFGMMRTSISGMAVQSDRLGTVADNIANAKTTGYKEASTEFSTLVLENSVNSYQSGGVETHVRRAVSRQGSFEYTSSSTDLAVKGNGFFIVEGIDGMTYLTRAGSFVKDAEGNLVNAAGYKLQGTPAAGGGLEVVNLEKLGLQATPSSKGALTVNLNSTADIVAAANKASANAATSTYTSKTSVVSYDNLGAKVTLDVYWTKTAANTWDVAVYNHANAPSGGGFPYTAGPLANSTLTFSATTGALASGGPSLSVAIPNGSTATIDVSQTSQLAADFTIRDASMNGYPASSIDHVEVSDKGELFAIFQSGARVKAYDVPLANVPSPDMLTSLTGNVFSVNAESGPMRYGAAGTGGLGNITSNALEQSTVDIATELTTMIETQRNYTANSKVFQTGADLSEVLVNLVR